MNDEEYKAGLRGGPDHEFYWQARYILQRQYTDTVSKRCCILTKELRRQMEANRRKKRKLRGLRKGIKDIRFSSRQISKLLAANFNERRSQYP